MSIPTERTRTLGTNGDDVTPGVTSYDTDLDFADEKKADGGRIYNNNGGGNQILRVKSSVNQPISRPDACFIISNNQVN